MTLDLAEGEFFSEARFVLRPPLWRVCCGCGTGPAARADIHSAARTSPFHVYRLKSSIEIGLMTQYLTNGQENGSSSAP